MLAEVVVMELIVGALQAVMDEDDDREMRGSYLDEALAARCASL